MESLYFSRPAQRPRYASEPATSLPPTQHPAFQRNTHLHRNEDTYSSPAQTYTAGPARSLFQTPPSRQGIGRSRAATTAFGAIPTAAAAGEQKEDLHGQSEPMPACRWLSCVYRGGQLGAAAYDRLSNELSVLQVPDDSKGACAFQMLQYIKLQTNPEVIVLPATAEAALLTAAKAPAAAATGAAVVDGEESDAGEVLVQLQRPSMFTYDKALKMLDAVVIRQQVQIQQQQLSAGAARQPGNAGAGIGRNPASLIDLGQQQQVAALGALLAVLLQQQEDGGGEGMLMVDNLTEMTLDGHLLVDGPSLAALDVFKEEEHPSAMGIGTSKEGVSVYGLLQRCVTGMGKRLMRQWFLRPVVQLDVISNRHDTIELLVAAPNTNEALRAAMKKVQDLPRLLARSRLMQARPQLQTFKQLSDSINQLMQLRQMIATLAPAAASVAVAGNNKQPHKAPSRHNTQGHSWLSDDEDNDGLGGGLFDWDSDRPSRGAGAAAAPQIAEGPWDKLRITTTLFTAISTELQACGALIGDVLDFSCPVEGCLVQPGVCDSLDELKATQQALPDLLTQVVESELQRVPPHVARRYSKQLWSVVYIPQVGFVMCVTGGKLSEELAEMLPDYNLAFMGEDGPAGAAAAAGTGSSAAGGPSAADQAGQLDTSCAYYYSDCTQQLNSQYGDLQHKIQDLETSICTELIKRLLAFSPCLSSASSAVAELDCLCSFAAAARELGYCRPMLTTDNVIIIEGGRHPLTELLGQGTFIPNDTRLGDVDKADHGSRQAQEQQGPGGSSPQAGGTAAAAPRMLLITGPNASGKSVYMKQVALLVYLAHVGSFIPADRAVIGLTDRILTRLAGMEAVGQHTSSFMADLGQVSTILNRATSRSLVVLDEFGKGTLTTDGVGLLAAILEHYAAQECPPFVLACTHFHELLDRDILAASPNIEHCTMQVLVSEPNGGDGGDDAVVEQEHTFLYKLVKGHVAASYGLHCARMCGVDKAVLLRAADVLALQQAGRAVQRLQLPQLEQRDEQYWQLVKLLAGVDLSKSDAVASLLEVMLEVEAACD